MWWCVILISVLKFVDSQNCRDNEPRLKECENLCDKDGNCAVRAALLLPQNCSFDANLPAVRSVFELALADDAIKQYMPGVTMELSAYDVLDCDAAYAVISAIDAYNDCAHVFFGPACDYALGKSLIPSSFQRTTRARVEVVAKDSVQGRHPWNRCREDCIDPSARETRRNGWAQAFLTSSRGCPIMSRIISGWTVVPVGDRGVGSRRPLPGGCGGPSVRRSIGKTNPPYLPGLFATASARFRVSFFFTSTMAASITKFGRTAVHTPTPSTLFEVEFCNIRGLHSNLNAVHHHLETARPALLFLTKTQILPPADTGYLNYPGYVLEESFKAKAGICLYVRADVCCRRLRCLEDPSFSMLGVHVDSGPRARIYVCLYRSHTGDVETTRLFEHLSRAADDAQERFPNAELVFLGDFNAHHNLWLSSSKTDHAGISAHTFALTHDLKHLVDQPTRIPDIPSQAPSLLDLLLTTHPQGYQVVVRAPLGSSDHCLISAKAPQAKPPRPAVVKRRIWHYGSADWDGMRDYFASVPWKQRCFSDRDLSGSTVAITEEIIMGMEYYIPHSDLISKGTRNLWYNHDCAEAASRKQAAYRAWIRGRALKDPGVDSLKAACNSASKASDAQRVARVGQELITHPAGSRSYWRLAKAVQKNFCQPSLPPLRCPDGTLAHKPQEKADLLAKLFAANSRIDDCNALPPSLPHCGTTMPDIKIRQREVRAELQSLDVRKASGPDGIPAVVLKKCAAELSPVLTRLYQCSYSLGRVPETWRVANVQPVPKKGDRSDPANYRPIAVTSVLCKVLEKVLNNHLTRYLEDHSLINDRQYGFRPKRSTGDLLAYLTHTWGEAIDKRGESLAISLDIAKVFDRVWHKSLLSKLPAYGLPAQFCSWVADFLHERRIRVLTDGSSSRFMSVNAGVPQGSVLSPTLFLLHINDLIPLGNIHCYADDSTVHAGYLGQAAAGQAVTREKRENLVIELNQALDHISEWGTRNLVGFNAKKTQACAFTAKTSPFLPLPSLQGTTLPLQSNISMLGMEVRRFFTPDQLCLLYKTQVRSCVEYCSHLWDGSAKYLLDALDRLQRRAIRIIGDEEVTKHLEPLQLRRDVASLSAFYRLYHGECSGELFSLIPPSPFLQRTTRAGLRCHRLTVATIPTRTKKFGDSFLCRTIRKWNALPAHVFPPSYNLGSFKRGVKKQHAGRQGRTAVSAIFASGLHLHLTSGGVESFVGPNYKKKKTHIFRCDIEPTTLLK
ncbi:hypothetical protein evm_011124 [Chilo suppressalis]|nr:hypothetical protein evm_011124 [Chilo suppressalis]